MAPITFAILIISLVAIVGLLVGAVRVGGIGLGPAGILFSGILFGHFGASIDPEITKFVFANSLAESDACSSAYAAVYPLTMILRIIAAQGIVFLLA